MTITVFGYLILFSTDFYDFVSPFSPSPNSQDNVCTLKFIKNTVLHAIFSTLFLVFGNLFFSLYFCHLGIIRRIILLHIKRLHSRCLRQCVVQLVMQSLV